MDICPVKALAFKQILKGEKPTQVAPPPRDEEDMGLMTEMYHVDEYPMDDHQILHGEETILNSQALSKIETTLMTEIIKHPECLTSDKIGELLDYVSSNEVQKYITRLKELFYEIDESEFVPIVSNFTKNGTFSSALKEVIATALKSYRAISHDDQVVSKIIFDIKKKLEITKLALKKDEIKMRKQTCTTNEEINELMNELLIIEKEIIKVKALKHKTPGGK